MADLDSGLMNDGRDKVVGTKDSSDPIREGTQELLRDTSPYMPLACSHWFNPLTLLVAKGG